MTRRNRYEREFTHMLQCAGARAFGMGRHALVVLLKAVGLRPGESVGVCGYTCLSVAEAVKVAGGRPVYLDVDEHLCISPDSLRSLATAALKVLILQHTFGLPGQLDELLVQAQRIGAIVIEDCAHSLGSRWKGRLLGTFGAGAIFSFQWGKSYSTGQGGMLTANQSGLLCVVDDVIAAIAADASMRSDASLTLQRLAYSCLRSLGGRVSLRSAYKKLAVLGLVKGSFREHLDFDIKGYVRLAGPMMSAAGLRRLTQWPELARRRQANAAAIALYLDKHGLPKWPCPKGCEPVMTRYPLLVSDKAGILAVAGASGLDLAGWYDSPVHPLRASQLSEVDYQPGICPNAERMIDQVVHFPTGEGFSEKLLRRGTGILLRGP